MAQKTISRELVFPNPDQPRQYFDEAKLEELAESIAMYGILQPLIVTKREDAQERISRLPDEVKEEVGPKARYMIVAGERRWRASALAGRPDLPCEVIKVDDTDAFILSLTENGQRQNMLPMEEARAYARLEASGRSPKKIARRLGISTWTVHRRLRLLNLAEDLQGLVNAGTIPISVAQSIARLTPANQHRVLKIADDAKMGVNDTLYLANRILAEQRQEELFDLGAYMRERAEEMAALCLAKAKSTGQQLALALRTAVESATDPTVLQEHLGFVQRRLAALAAIGAQDEDETASEEEPLPTLAELLAEEPDKEAELAAFKGKRTLISPQLAVRVVKWPSNKAIPGIKVTDNHAVIVVERNGKPMLTLSAIEMAPDDEEDMAVVIYLDLDYGHAPGDQRWVNTSLALQYKYSAHENAWLELVAAQDKEGWPLYREQGEAES